MYNSLNMCVLNKKFDFRRCLMDNGIYKIKLDKYVIIVIIF